MPTVDGVENMAVQMESHPETKRDPESIPEPARETKPEEAAPFPTEPLPIPTESPGSEGGASTVSISTIKRKLRIQPVTVMDFAKYMKSKRRADLNYEWEVRDKQIDLIDGL